MKNPRVFNPSRVDKTKPQPPPERPHSIDQIRGEGGNGPSPGASRPRHACAKPCPLEEHHDDQRQGEWDQKVEKPENDQGGQHVRLRDVGHRREEHKFENAEAAGRMADERRRKRSQKHRQHDHETWLEMSRQDEIDDAGRAKQLERGRKKLTRHDGRTGIFQLGFTDDDRRKVEDGSDDIERHQREEDHPDNPRRGRIGQSGGEEVLQPVEKRGIDGQHHTTRAGSCRGRK